MTTSAEKLLEMYKNNQFVKIEDVKQDSLEALAVLDGTLPLSGYKVLILSIVEQPRIKKTMTSKYLIEGTKTDNLVYESRKNGILDRILFGEPKYNEEYWLGNSRSKGIEQKEEEYCNLVKKGEEVLVLYK